MKSFDQTKKGKKVKEKMGEGLSKSHTFVTPGNGAGSLSPSKTEGEEDDNEENRKVQEARKSLKDRFKRN